MTNDNALTVFNQLGESKTKEFVITEEQIAFDDHIIWKFQFFIDTLKEMLKRGMIKRYAIYDEPWNMQRRVIVEKI